MAPLYFPWSRMGSTISNTSSIKENGQKRYPNMA